MKKNIEKAIYIGIGAVIASIGFSFGNIYVEEQVKRFLSGKFQVSPVKNKSV